MDAPLEGAVPDVGAPLAAPSSGRASPAPTKPCHHSGPLCTRDRIYEMDHLASGTARPTQLLTGPRGPTGHQSPPFLKGDLGGFSNGLYGATLVVALQGGHKTRPYQKIPPNPPF